MQKHNVRNRSRDAFVRYRRAVEFIEGLWNLPRREGVPEIPLESPLRVKRMQFFLDLLGNPEKRMKFVHVSGSAGKGSVSNMIHSILVTSGRRAGLHTSPYVSVMIEKFKVGKRYVSPGEFADLVEEMKPAFREAHMRCPWGHPSYPEVCLALALLYFRKKKCTWAVLEVSRGGANDPTNVIPPPVASVITNVHYEHTRLLGNTLTAIARVKGGIIKQGSLFFTMEERAHVRKVFQDICRRKKALYRYVRGPGDDASERNATLAGEIMRELGFPEQAIAKGIREARMPCRFEIVRKHPLVILDGAHNGAEMDNCIARIKELRFRNLHAVIGMAEGRDPKEMFGSLIPLTRTVVVTRFQMKERKVMSPFDLIKAVRRHKSPKFVVRLDPKDALDYALRAAGKDDLVLVTGSLYLAGEIRKRWYPEEYVVNMGTSFPG